MQRVSEDNLGEQFLLLLNTADTYHLECLRIPASNEQRAFDEGVLSLTKILIDSLNVSFLTIPSPFILGLVRVGYNE